MGDRGDGHYIFNTFKMYIYVYFFMQAVFVIYWYIRSMGNISKESNLIFKWSEIEMHYSLLQFNLPRL